MRITLGYLTPLFAAAGAAAAILAAPAAGAQPAPTPEPAPAPRAEAAPAPSLLPQCVDTGGAQAIGGTTTECATPGNSQIDATPAQQEYVGPWGDMFGGDGFFFP